MNRQHRCSEICTDTHLQASCGKDNLFKFYWDLDGLKVLDWECLFVHRKQGLFLSVHVDDMKMAGRKQTMSATWKNLMNMVVALGEPTSFLDHVYLGCSNHEFLPQQKKIATTAHAKTVARVIRYGTSREKVR